MHILWYNILILVEVIMYFKRKAYDKLLEWKKLYSEKYVVLLEGAYVKIGLNQEKPYKTRVWHDKHEYEFI